MYILTVEDHFSSAHQLKGYKGKCENLHGHNWKIVLSVKGSMLNDIGILIDFNDMKNALRSVIQDLDHRNLNDLDYFSENNPSSENIARYIAEKLIIKLAEINKSLSIDSVTVWESDNSRCTYIPDPPGF